MRTQNTSTGNCDSLISAASSLLWVVIYFTSPAQGAATCGSRPALCGFTSGLSRPWKPPPSGDMVPGQLQQSRGQVQPRVHPPQPPCCPCSALATGPSSAFLPINKKVLDTDNLSPKGFPLEELLCCYLNDCNRVNPYFNLTFYVHNIYAYYRTLYTHLQRHIYMHTIAYSTVFALQGLFNPELTGVQCTSSSL